MANASGLRRPSLKARLTKSLQGAERIVVLAVGSSLRGDDEVGEAGIKVGYGLSGYGDEAPTLLSGTKREGTNRYDELGNVLGDVYVDNGKPRPLD